jgi:phospholipid-binding lipoprotein MlaA
VGTAVGLEKHYEDFGLTLAHWGYQNSAYMVIPLFGPSTVRDGFSRPVTFYALSVYPFIDSPWLRYGIYSFEVLEDRRELLNTDSAVDDALDPYVFVRDAYLQNRKSKMAGGNANAVEDIYLEENQPATQTKK